MCLLVVILLDVHLQVTLLRCFVPFTNSRDVNGMVMTRHMGEVKMGTHKSNG